jgi:tol-pal system protein YbgF
VRTRSIARHSTSTSISLDKFAARDPATYDHSTVVRAILLAGVLSLAAAGCVGPATQLRRENRQLGGELTDARAELRKERRKAHDLETENVVLRDKLGGGARASDHVPKLRVEVIAPDEPAPDEDVAQGDDVIEDDQVYDGADYDFSGDDDDLEYAPDDDDVAPAPPPKKTPKKVKVVAQATNGAAAAYEAAVAKVKAHDHDGAVSALRAFLDDFPKDDLADNAQYWLGEVYYDEKDWARSVVEFRATVDGYPRGNKVPDALLKMGYCFVQLGQDAKARSALQNVVDTYPGTQPAKLAAARLEELQ